MDPTSHLPFTCTACDSCFLRENKLGDHIRRSILLEWKGCAPRIHEASTPTMGGFCICEGCRLSYLHKGISAHTRNCKRAPPHTRLQAHPHASLPPPLLPVSRPALQQPSASSSLAFLPPLTTDGQRAAMSSQRVFKTSPPREARMHKLIWTSCGALRRAAKNGSLLRSPSSTSQ